MEVGSTDLLFKPSQRIGDTDPSNCEDGLWKSVFENGELVRYDSSIPMPTPGSVSLIFQAVLPYVLFLPSPVPLRLSIEGGTNVSKSPSIDYVSQVLVPVLSSWLGLPAIKVEILRRGWSGGRGDIGKVVFEFQPLTSLIDLKSFEITSRGDLKKINATVIAPDAEDLQQIKQYVIDQASASFPGTDIDFIVDEVSGYAQRCYLLLVAETTSNCKFGYDQLAERKQAKGQKKSDAKAKIKLNRQLVSDIVRDLRREWDKGGCVDEYLEDQLVVFQAITSGKTRILTGSPAATLHTQTARWVAESILDVDFDGKGRCSGLRRHD